MELPLFIDTLDIMGFIMEGVVFVGGDFFVILLFKTFLYR